MHDYYCQEQQQHASKEHLNGVGLIRHGFWLCVCVSGLGGGLMTGGLGEVNKLLSRTRYIIALSLSLSLLLVWVVGQGACCCTHRANQAKFTKHIFPPSNHQHRTDWVCFTTKLLKP